MQEMRAMGRYTQGTREATDADRGVMRLNEACGEALLSRSSNWHKAVLFTNIFQDFEIHSENRRVWRNFF